MLAVESVPQALSVDWLPSLLVALIPALLAIVPAVIAGKYANSAKKSDRDVQLLRDLENRNSERKFQAYQPMIDHLGRLLTDRVGAAKGDSSQQNALKATNKAKTKKGAGTSQGGGEGYTQATTIEVLNVFSTWICIYGSDEAIRAAQRLMQCAFNSAPPTIFIRLYSDFLLAARRDLGYPTTETSQVEIVGLRVNDVYTNRDFRDALTMPFEQLCLKENWVPPWEASAAQLDVELPNPAEA